MADVTWPVTANTSSSRGSRPSLDTAQTLISSSFPSRRARRGGLGSTRAAERPQRSRCTAAGRRPTGNKLFTFGAAPRRTDVGCTTGAGSGQPQHAYTPAVVGTPSLPVIDVAVFASGADHDTSSGGAVAERIDTVFRELGFLLVTGHGIDDDRQATDARQLRAFFALPVEEKELIAIGRSPCHRGYVGIATRDARRRQHPGRRPQGDDRQRARARTGPSRGRGRDTVARAQPAPGPARVPCAWQAYFDAGGRGGATVSSAAWRWPSGSPSTSCSISLARPSTTSG